MITHLEQTLGTQVHRIVVQRLDLVNDTTTVEVRYQLSADRPVSAGRTPGQQMTLSDRTGWTASTCCPSPRSNPSWRRCNHSPGYCRSTGGAALTCYTLAARRHRRRFKIRTRSYLDSAECWLEVKTRDRREHTVKQRQPHGVSPDTLDLAGREIALPGLAIVETKTAGRPCAADRLLWRAGCRLSLISKYGTGWAALRPDLPSHKWHRVLHRYFWSPS